MPGGGNKYRQWYAMRARLRAAGEWDAHRAGVSGLSDAARAAQNDLPDIAEPSPDDFHSPEDAKRPRLGGGEGEASDSDSIPSLEGSPTAEGNYLFIFNLQMSLWAGPTGFSLLLVSSHPEDAKELIEDAICLISNRWHIEFELRQQDGCWYAWGKQSRFTVAEATIQRALGDLFSQELVQFQKGPPDTSFDSALRYQKCKRKWNVPDVVSQTSDDTGGAGTPVINFRKKQK